MSGAELTAVEVGEEKEVVMSRAFPLRGGNKTPLPLLYFLAASRRLFHLILCELRGGVQFEGQ